ncbi:MAG: tetratricopeptide repeat protein [Gemmatimonadota bacterium]|jgi:serine/threonine-protein kinase
MAIRIRRFLTELRRRKVYHVAVVYLVVGWSVSEGAEFLFGDVLGLPGVVWRAVMVLVILGFPIALVLAWAYEVRPEQPSSVGDPIDTAADPGTAEISESADPADLVGTAGSRASDPSIAVLPFASLSSDPEGDYFADGISEEITNALAKQRGLRVAARTSAFAFKGQQIDIREIGLKLNVAHVVEGSVRRSDRGLRITAQLINARDGYHLWSDQFDRDHGDVFRIQEEIADAVARRLLEEVGGVEETKVLPAELSAYDSYLKGRQAMAAFSPQSLAEAVGHFETAAQLDNRFAPALASLAEALTMQSIGFSVHASAETLPRAGDLAAKALDLDAQLPEAHLARALFKMYWERDYSEAKESLDRALDLNPNFATAYLWVEFFATYVEYDFPKALAALQRARELSPLDARFRGRMGTVNLLFGDYGEAERLFLEETADDPTDPMPQVGLADTYMRSGRTDEAVSRAERALELGGRHPAFLGVACVFCGLGGALEKAEELLRELEGLSQEGRGSGFWLGLCHAGMGRFDRAFECFDQAIDERDGSLVYIFHTPREIGIHRDPRFVPLLEELNLGHLARFI